MWGFLNMPEEHEQNQQVQAQADNQQMPELTEEDKKRIEERMKQIKEKVEGFKDKAVEKFQNYIHGISILPPEKKGQEDINVLVVVDDRDSKKMTKQELADRISSILTDFGKEDNILPKIILTSELWQQCFDSNYEYLQLIAISTPIYDVGVLEACRISEVHKNLTLKKFDKYIVAYVAAGGIFRGEGNEKSDIDVFIVIDDTDVKKMTRYELRDKLSAIIYQMAFEASAMTGVKRQLHVQTYLLTDFWDTLRDSASPVIFTFLRDGIPFFDRGIYMPWKHLLDMGRIQPSREAIKKFKASGDQFFEQAKRKLLQIGTEDLYYSVLNPAQSALMMRGHSPMTHKETAKMVREIFVQKEQLLEEKYADILEEMVKRFKSVEYGELKELPGDEVGQIMAKCDDFRKRMESLYKQIELDNDKRTVVGVYDQTCAAAREVLTLEGHSNVASENLLDVFNTELVQKGKIPEAQLDILKTVVEIKEKYDRNDITTSDIDKVHKESKKFIKAVIDHLQRTQLQKKLEKTLRVKHKEGVAELVVIENAIFLTTDGQIRRASFENGSLGSFEEVDAEKMDEELKGAKSVAHIPTAVLKAIEAELGELELVM